ncbi:MAG TPA: glycine reductase, partial [Dehalococcoidia bacterium]|nr:glycine reductase [Dehalococcoidia bacterium]
MNTITLGNRHPVIMGVRYFLAHAPGLVRNGHKPSVDISRTPSVTEDIASHLRTFENAVGYPPNRAYLGDIFPDQLRDIDRPWFQHNGTSERRQRHGDIMPEAELLGMLKISDVFDSVWLEE